MNSLQSMVDLIFTKCSLTYGRDFLGRWEGQDLAMVKADWAHELGGLLSSPERITYALSHLPEKAPTVLQFRDICLRGPEKKQPQLPAPKADPAKVREIVGRLKRQWSQQ